MRTYALQDLVRVRQHREEQAGEAVARARRRLEAARAELLARQQALASYAGWRVEEERRRLDALMRRVLTLGELSDTRQEIALLREREFEFADQVKQAEAAVGQAEAAVEEARQRHAATVRDLEKLLEHQTQWQQQERQAFDHAEDLEREEFRPLSSGFTPGPHERN